MISNKDQSQEADPEKDQIHLNLQGHLGALPGIKTTAEGQEVPLNAGNISRLIRDITQVRYVYCLFNKVSFPTKITNCKHIVMEQIVHIPVILWKYIVLCICFIYSF